MREPRPLTLRSVRLSENTPAGLTVWSVNCTAHSWQRSSPRVMGTALASGALPVAGALLAVDALAACGAEEAPDAWPRNRPRASRNRAASRWSAVTVAMARLRKPGLGGARLASASMPSTVKAFRAMRSLRRAAGGASASAASASKSLKVNCPALRRTAWERAAAVVPDVVAVPVVVGAAAWAASMFALTCAFAATCPCVTLTGRASWRCKGLSQGATGHCARLRSSSARCSVGWAVPCAPNWPPCSSCTVSCQRASGAWARASRPCTSSSNWVRRGQAASAWVWASIWRAATWSLATDHCQGAAAGGAAVASGALAAEAAAGAALAGEVEVEVEEGAGCTRTLSPSSATLAMATRRARGSASMPSMRKVSQPVSTRPRPGAGGRPMSKRLTWALPRMASVGGAGALRCSNTMLRSVSSRPARASGRIASGIRALAASSQWARSTFCHCTATSLRCPSRKGRALPATLSGLPSMRACSSGCTVTSTSAGRLLTKGTSRRNWSMRWLCDSTRSS